MRKYYIAGNWKMNGNTSLPSTFFSELSSEFPHGMSELAQKVEAGIAPTFVHLTKANECKSLKILAQNFCEHDSGAFTGEVSLPMLKEIGITASIVGHSERRQYFGETNESVGLKVKAAIAHKIQPIACVGESLNERNAGHVEEIIGQQMKSILDALEQPSSDLVIAYEPIWAIGTGQTASKEQAQEVHSFIRNLISETWGKEFGDQIRILYGGSVKPSNASDLLSQKDIDGALVGGASLKASDFAAIIKAALELS